VIPFQIHDLAKPAAGKHQQANSGDGGGELNPFLLHFAQHLADTPKLGGA